MEFSKLLDLVFDLFQRQIQIASFQNKQNNFSANSFSVTRKYFAKNKLWKRKGKSLPAHYVIKLPTKKKTVILLNLRNNTYRQELNEKPAEGLEIQGGKYKLFNGHPQLDVGSAKRVIICGFLLVKSGRFFTDSAWFD